jgi:hypothetical protein
MHCLAVPTTICVYCSCIATLTILLLCVRPSLHGLDLRLHIKTAQRNPPWLLNKLESPDCYWRFYKRARQNSATATDCCRLSMTNRRQTRCALVVSRRCNLIQSDGRNFYDRAALTSLFYIERCIFQPDCARFT